MLRGVRALPGRRAGHLRLRPGPGLGFSGREPGGPLGAGATRGMARSGLGFPTLRFCFGVPRFFLGGRGGSPSNLGVCCFGFAFKAWFCLFVFRLQTLVPPRFWPSSLVLCCSPELAVAFLRKTRCVFPKCVGLAPRGTATIDGCSISIHFFGFRNWIAKKNPPLTLAKMKGVDNKLLKDVPAMSAYIYIYIYIHTHTYAVYQHHTSDSGVQASTKSIEVRITTTVCLRRLVIIQMG